MTAFDRSLSPKMLTLTDILSDLLVMAPGAVMLAAGIKLLDSPLCRLGKYSSLPKLSKVRQYLPVAIAGGSMIHKALMPKKVGIRAFLSCKLTVLVNDICRMICYNSIWKRKNDHAVKRHDMKLRTYRRVRFCSFLRVMLCWFTHWIRKKT